MRWHRPPDTWFEIRALAFSGWARYLSVTEAPHNIELLWEVWRPEWGSNPRSPTFQAGSFNHCTSAPVTRMRGRKITWLFINKCVTPTMQKRFICYEIIQVLGLACTCCVIPHTLSRPIRYVISSSHNFIKHDSFTKHVPWIGDSDTYTSSTSYLPQNVGLYQ